MAAANAEIHWDFGKQTVAPCTNLKEPNFTSPDSGVDSPHEPDSFRVVVTNASSPSEKTRQNKLTAAKVTEQDEKARVIPFGACAASYLIARDPRRRTFTYPRTLPKPNPATAATANIDHSAESDAQQASKFKVPALPRKLITNNAETSTLETPRLLKIPHALVQWNRSRVTARQKRRAQAIRSDIDPSYYALQCDLKVAKMTRSDEQ